MIRRGQVYYDVYRDKIGRDRRIPVLVMTSDESTSNSNYVQTVRIKRYDTTGRPTIVPVPADGWKDGSQMGACVILAETISTTRVADLYGPVDEIKPEWMAKVEEGIKMQIGMIPMGETVPRPYGGMYTGAMGQQTRETRPMSNEAAREYVGFGKDAYVYRRGGIDGLEPNFWPGTGE